MIVSVMVLSVVHVKSATAMIVQMRLNMLNSYAMNVTIYIARSAVIQSRARMELKDATLSTLAPKGKPADAFCKNCGSQRSDAEICTQCDERVCKLCPYFTCDVCADTEYFRCEDCGPDSEVIFCKKCCRNTCLDCRCDCAEEEDDDGEEEEDDD